MSVAKLWRLVGKAENPWWYQYIVSGRPFESECHYRWEMRVWEAYDCRIYPETWSNGGKVRCSVVLTWFVCPPKPAAHPANAKTVKKMRTKRKRAE